MDIKETSSKSTWHLCGLSGLQETSKGNFLHPTINPNQRNLYIERIPRDTCIYEDLPHKETSSSQRKQMSVLHYYKNPKPLEIKVHIIYPNFGTLELWTHSNLTFGGYLASTAPILSVRSSSSLLCRFCLERMRTVQLIDDSLASSVGAISEKELD